jgi:hypothetical protein
MSARWTAGALFLLGLISICQPVLAATPIQHELPRCTLYFEKTFDNGTFRYYWCASNRPGYEARLDVWRFANGRWGYFVSSHFDCHNASDYALIPPITKQKVC